MIEVVTTDAKPLNKAQRIREYIAANPKVVAKDVAKTLGVTLQYVYTVMYKVKARASKVKKSRKVSKKLGRPRKVTEAPANWKTIAFASSDIPFYKDSVTDTTPKRMAQLAYEAGVAKAKLRMQSNIDKIKVGSEVGGLTLTEVGNGKVRWVKPDAVNHPAHYKVGGIETIDFIEAKKLGYNLGNVVKYLTRADHKGNKLEDLRKAQWYLEREVWNVENNKKTA